MIAVAVASEALMAKLDANTRNLAKLADPRTIEHGRRAGGAAGGHHDAGLLHHRHHPLAETGAPTALMELAYRLAVDESPYISNIRNNVITLITPIVEVDGRDREVDLYGWHLTHPGRNCARR